MTQTYIDYCRVILEVGDDRCQGRLPLYCPDVRNEAESRMRGRGSVRRRGSRSVGGGGRSGHRCTGYGGEESVVEMQLLRLARIFWGTGRPDPIDV